MASELSQFIESELRQKGYAYEDDEDNPHANLIGALRVEVWSDKQQQQAEPDWPGGPVVSRLHHPAVCAAPKGLISFFYLIQARVKEQETQKKLFNIKRVVCIGGGVALVLVAWALLIASSKNRADPGEVD